MKTRSAVWVVLLVVGLILVVSGIPGTLPDVLGAILTPARMEEAATTGQVADNLAGLAQQYQQQHQQPGGRA